MKTFILIIMMSAISLGWEVNTHRAIDRSAINKSKNLIVFLKNSKTDHQNYDMEEFEGYKITYLKYITDTEKGEGNGIARWHQTFDSNPSWQNMIEAGTILEDAQWPHWSWDPDWYDRADGRFNNHFADPQQGYKGLWLGGMSALAWVQGGGKNVYGYQNALEYFKQGFTKESEEEIRESLRLSVFRAQGSVCREEV